MKTLHDPLLGVVLNERYRVESVIARGGMAMVYRGTDLRLDREVAIKVMHQHLLDDETFVERFRREAIHAARLSHPNLIAVHDQGSDDRAVYLVMDYLESVTLRKELKHRGSLTPRQAIVVTDAILAALEAVHGAGIIHRDLKPDNVLLGTDGQIKLADFGLARAVSTSTTTKTLIGTVGYVAPELVTRTGADERTDLYTVGIMLYEMLTGSQPYTDDVPIQVAYRHVHDTVPAPSEAVAGVSPTLDAIVLWATSRKPEDRPADASELRLALAEARTQLSEEELDLAEGSGAPVADAPVLTATITIDDGDPAEPRQKEPKARTDEIPYLAEGEDDATSAGAPAPLAPAAAAAARSAAPAEGLRHSGRNRRRTRTALGLSAAAAVIALAGWGAIASVETTAEVPAAVAGQEQADVASALTAAGFTTATREQFSTAVPAGKVIGTEPAAGTELDKDAVVTILVSKGEELFAAPDVSKMTESEARSAIEGASLQVGAVDREHSSSVPEGSVISQSLERGEEVAKGTEIDLVVSKGAEPLVIPDVTGVSYEAAYGRLARMGLRIAKDEVYSDHTPKGDVVAHYPKAAAKKNPGDLVILKVSKGKEPEKPKDEDTKADDDS
ncbi:Stk1 family PASTA domain-containing Ser/Thr kinase [Brevibacterium gallinarum]|uniref:non-specific serine/threonine protein kinase n=1 Tax=Brevibacterium gallinarum TaxID=2762220 RepID=A0ABR8WT15_9MICO|nr:Stk1 family PASTA domain-containing Ser/Thr kinase [Brevibacterium gallinarum]MBD8020213.1 Stk1 family PASTA domain-containing Ser/Thr kinase [Brevibacterium gallinarum]